MFVTTPLAAFNDNYIWMLSKEDYPDMLIVDPGDAEVVLKAIDQYQKPLGAILITHHHADHTGGVAQLKQTFDVPVYGPSDSPFKGITHPLKAGDQLSLLGEKLEIQEVPGHTLDHISFFKSGAAPQLFCGDTLFLAGCGRLFEGTPQQMLAAMEYFKTLPDETSVYAAHEYSLANLAFAKAVEPDNTEIDRCIELCESLRAQGMPTLPSSILVEKQINPFMRSNQPSIQTSANQYKNTRTSSELDVFSAIREWKNNF